MKTPDDLNNRKYSTNLKDGEGRKNDEENIKRSNRSSDLSIPSKTTPKVGLKFMRPKIRPRSPHGRYMHI